MNETELMQSIKTNYGAAITAACQSSAVPPAFLAALIAGESGGNPDAKRFESGVLHALWEVLLGRKTAYGSISRADLVAYVTRISSAPRVSPDTLPADAFQRVDGLATSWGLTQIMGYHILEKAVGHDADVSILKDTNTHLAMAIGMIEGFAKEFHIDERIQFEKLFRCWNTGRPDGKTFDPMYVNNGMLRISIWVTQP